MDVISFEWLKSADPTDGRYYISTSVVSIAYTNGRKLRISDKYRRLCRVPAADYSSVEKPRE